MGKLFIQRRTKPMLKVKCPYICVLAIRDMNNQNIDWAEYDPSHDYQPPYTGATWGTLTAEDYYLEIEGLKP